MHKIDSVSTKGKLKIVAVFYNGIKKEYDVKKMFPVYPQMRQLENKELFNQVQVDAGGYGISWNDELDLDAETIWEEGREVGSVSTSPVLQLAYRLTEARDKAGLTQKQLAQKTGIYQADISKIERGLSNPSFSTLQRLAEGLGMKLEINFVK